MSTGAESMDSSATAHPQTAAGAVALGMGLSGERKELQSFSRFQ